MNGVIKGLIIRLSGMDKNKILLGAVVGTFLFWYMTSGGSDTLDAELATTKLALDAEKKSQAESEKAIKERDLIRASLATLGARFDTASKQLPSEIHNAEVLKFVSELAHSAGVNIRENEPKEPVRDDIIERIPLRVAGRGSFAEITNFFYYIASKEKIARVQKFVINSDLDKKEDRSPIRGNVALTFEAEVVSYRFVGDEKPSKEVKK
jgi:Tfp pilus assembly protein PilO